MKKKNFQEIKLNFIWMIVESREKKISLFLISLTIRFGIILKNFITKKKSQQEN